MPVSIDAACTATLGMKPYSRLPERCSCVLRVLAAALPLLIYVNRSPIAHCNKIASQAIAVTQRKRPATGRTHQSGRYRESRSREVHMDSSSSPSSSSAYFESLMQAGQQSMKQFDDALTSAMGVEGKPADARCFIAICRRSKLATTVLVADCGILERHSRQQICSGFRRQAEIDASGTRRGITRLTINLSRNPT